MKLLDICVISGIASALLLAASPPKSKPPSTGRIGYDLKTITLSGVECAKLLPSGAVMVDLMCCKWVDDKSMNGRQILVGRSSFSDLPPKWRQKARAECTQRAGSIFTGK